MAVLRLLSYLVVMKWYIKLLRWIWEFPQCLLGFILTLCYKVEYKETFKGIPIYAGNFPGGISLGLYTIMNETSWKYNRNMIKEHEWGHTRQSLYLGPLYLVIIGIPSGLHASIIEGPYYYDYFTERWADKLGGVIRKYE